MQRAMTNDLISRQAAIKAIEDVNMLIYKGNVAVGARYCLKKEEVVDILNEIPTIDAIPVVRCKDCKWWGIHKSLKVPWCFKMHIDKSEDGYCDSGERKRDETD